MIKRCHPCVTETCNLLFVHTMVMQLRQTFICSYHLDPIHSLFKCKPFSLLHQKSETVINEERAPCRAATA